MKKWELFCLVINLVIYKTVTGYSKIFSDIAGSAAPIMALFSGGIAFIFIWVLLSVYEKWQGKTILDIAEGKFGKWAKYGIFIMLFAYLIFSAAINLRETGEFIKAVSFPTAPLAFVFCILAAAAVLCCAQGFDAIGRAHSVVVPILIFGVVIIACFALPAGEISNLFPYLGYGLESIFLKGLSSIGLYGDLIILFLLAPFSVRETNIKRTAIGAVGIGIIINIVIVFAYTMTAPYTVLGSVVHPFHQLVKLFSAGRMFQRIDGYFMYIAAMSSILSLSVNIFFASFIAGRTLNLPKTRPLSYPLGLIVILSALLFRNRETVYFWAKNSLWIWFLIIFALAAFVLMIPKKRRF